jgi:hypothetical protein
MEFPEKRRFERRVIRRQAKIVVAGAQLRDCLVLNISDGGVRLLVENVTVPDRFVLLLADGYGNDRPRDCKVAWRRGSELGAEFLDAVVNRPNQPSVTAVKPATL